MYFSTAVIEFQRHIYKTTYRQTSNISRSKSQNVYVSRIVLKFSLHNLLKPGV